MHEQGSEIESYIRRFSPFDHLDHEYIAKLLEHSELVGKKPGTLLFRRGKTSDHRYFLVDGTVDLISAGFETTTVAAGSERARYTLAESSPTKVSAVAKTDVSLLKVETDFLDLALAWSDAASHNSSAPVVNASIETGAQLNEMQVDYLDHDWTSGLLSSPILTQIPFANVQQLFAKFERLSAPAGTEIIKEGAPGDYFYVIASGKARVTNITGKTDITLETGQCFGEEALVADTPRNATVTMLTSGELMRLGKEDFTNLMHQPAQRYIELENVDMAAGDFVLLDVRTPLEYRLHNMPGSRNFPLAKLRSNLEQLAKKKLYVITPEGGRRSELAAFLLAQEGFETYILKDE